MPTLDKKKLDMYNLDSFKLDRFNTNANRIDGVAVNSGITSSLLHFNGTDVSQVFSDATGKIWSAESSNAQLDTDYKKFGTASGFFSSYGYIDTLDSADFDVGSGDFTIDFWMRRNDSAAGVMLIGQCDSSFSALSRSIYVQITGPLNLLACVCAGSSSYQATGNATLTNDSLWHHIAVVRYGNTMTLYLDGAVQGTANLTGVTVNNSSNKFAIGRAGEYNGQYFNGWIDEFRFSKGIARWTSNFTPPTSEYTT